MKGSLRSLLCGENRRVMSSASSPSASVNAEVVLGHVLARGKRRNRQALRTRWPAPRSVIYRPDAATSPWQPSQEDAVTSTRQRKQ